jgi:hypothetical protein
MNYKAMYEAVSILNKDYRIPVEALVERTGITEDELLRIVEDTGLKHYRLLGMLPPSEIILQSRTMSRVKDFYSALERKGLGESIETNNGWGFKPNKDGSPYCLNVPLWGQYWHAWDPAVLELLE